jgi:hypothetical protein
MHESCGVNLNPDDPRNVRRRCKSHFPKESGNKEKGGEKRRRRVNEGSSGRAVTAAKNSKKTKT